jgi:hypothetical protein
MQELHDFIKRSKLRIMGFEEGEKVQAKVIHNIFSKIITENFLNLKKDLPIQVQEASRTTNNLDQVETSPWHIVIKTTSTENKERILKAIREGLYIFICKPTKITADFSSKTLKAKRA